MTHNPFAKEPPVTADIPRGKQVDNEYKIQSQNHTFLFMILT